MKEQDWWWRLRREFKKTDPAQVMRISERRMQKLEKSIMTAIETTSTTWTKPKKKPLRSPNP